MALTSEELTQIVDVNGLKSSLLEFKDLYINSSVLADWNLTTTTAKDYIKNKPTVAGLSDSVVCIESNSVPTSSTTQYTDAFSQTRTYKVGDQIKVYNSADQKYDIYVLYNLSNGVATWAQSGTSYDYSFDTYTVVISSNQGLIDPDILGATVTVGSAVLENGDTLKVPKVSTLPTPTASAITGYRNTLTVNGHIINSYYETEILTVTITKIKGNTDISNFSINVSADGQTIGTITNSNTLKIPYGVNYTCTPNSVSDYTSSTAITKNWEDGFTHTLTFTYVYLPIGCFIFERKGGIYTALEWSQAKLAGTVQDSDVIGIIVNTLNCSFMIAPNNLGGFQIAYGSSVTMNGAAVYQTNQVALARMDGKTDTILMTNTYGTDSKYAAGASRNYIFGNGSKGYIPALGQLDIMYANKSTIDELIVACGAEPIPTNSRIWSSTYFGAATNGTYFWIYSSGSPSNGKINDGGYVLPVCDWSHISTRLHFTATDGSSVSNVPIEIIDSSGDIVTVYTGADGDAYLSLNDGTYTVRSNGRILSTDTFTVTGLDTTINISTSYCGYVDFELSSGIKWAIGNIIPDNNNGYKIGEHKDYGAYVSWGNIVPHFSSDGSTFDDGYDWGTSNSGSPYVNSPGKQVTANIASNDVDHDAVLALLGTPWHLPTKEDFLELYDATDREWITINGVTGYKFMKKSDHSIYIFIPASGGAYSTQLNSRNVAGCYWASSMYSTDKAYRLLLLESSVIPLDAGSNKFYGYSIRAVQ